MSLKDLTARQYTENGYNCAEALLHAANEYYDLQIAEEDLKMIGGFGAGMYSGQLCGALAASIAALSKKIIQTKAHDMVPELSRADQLVVRNFRNKLGGTSCAEIKPVHFDREVRCLHTVCLAAEALEESMDTLLQDPDGLF